MLRRVLQYVFVLILISIIYNIFLWNFSLLRAEPWVIWKISGLDLNCVQLMMDYNGLSAIATRVDER